jgi:hypothetical protein
MTKAKKRTSNYSNDISKLIEKLDNPKKRNGEAYYQAIRNQVKRELGLTVTEAEDRLAARTSARDQGEYDPIAKVYYQAYRKQLIQELAKKKNRIQQLAGGKAGEIKNQKPEERGGNAAPATVINIDKLGVLGNVQAENVQTGDYASIHKQTITTEKKKSILIRILKITGAIIIGIIGSFIAAILFWYFW